MKDYLKRGYCKEKAYRGSLDFCLDVYGAGHSKRRNKLMRKAVRCARHADRAQIKALY